MSGEEHVRLREQPVQSPWGRGVQVCSRNRKRLQREGVGGVGTDPAAGSVMPRTWLFLRCKVLSTGATDNYIIIV